MYTMYTIYILATMYALYSFVYTVVYIVQNSAAEHFRLYVDTCIYIYMTIPMYMYLLMSIMYFVQHIVIESVPA